MSFLLNGHPECASVGEAAGRIKPSRFATYECSCGRQLGECEFWADVAQRTAQLGYPVDPRKKDLWNTNFRIAPYHALNVGLFRTLRSDLIDDLRDATLWRIPAVRRAIAARGDNSWSLARAVLDLTGKRTFVDTSRDHQRPKLLALNPRLDVYVVHLVRDPRGNSASIMKRHETDDATYAAKLWRKTNVAADRVRRFFPPDRWLRIRYEDLCADVSETLDRVCDFLQVRRFEPPADFRAGEHHVVGNPMRSASTGAIRQDTSWKERLSESDLDKIARVVGQVSHYFGYGWP